MASSSSSSPRNWVYDVFPSFSGEDVRITFLSHFLKELDRKLIMVFKDNEIERSHSLDPALKLAIRTSRIAVVVFSETYASSSWCLNELLEIVRCKEEIGQMVIPVFYRLDPSHVRKQTGDFGKFFEETCKKKTEDEIKLWQKTLTYVANILGYHSQNWDNEAKMIEDITNDVLKKLIVTTSKDYEDFVGIEKHMVKMSALLNLESEEVRMVGIWGSSGIGKTTIARALYGRISCRFQGSVYIDKAFIYKSMHIYGSANPDDYNMKLHMQRNFLSKILDRKEVEIAHLGVVEERLKHQKVLIFIDDLNDQVVLDALVRQNHWFGSGSRIIVITKDKHFLRAHGIDHIYEVFLPSEVLALEMFCRSAFGQNYPPDGFLEIASEVALLAGNLPLGLNVFGSSLRGRNIEDWMGMLPRFRDDLDGNVEKTLRVSYDGLNYKKDKGIFRHIACLFNGENVNDIKLLLEGSDLDVDIGLKNLVDKSLVQIRDDIVEMHRLLQEMGKEIVSAQSNEPGEREFLVDSKDICNVLKDNTGTQRVLGIALDMGKIDELHIHENAFKGMRNLLFLRMYNTKKWDQKKEVRWHLPQGFDYLPPTLRLLRLDGYPMKYLPSNFCPENLVKLQMPGSKVQKLWEGVHSLAGLRKMDLQRSIYLKEIPDLSMATNLETLDLSYCSSLVELTSSIQHLNQLDELNMSFCEKLETLPTGINLQSLRRLDLDGCSQLKTFPDISSNISELILTGTGIREFPSNLHLENLIGFMLRKIKSDEFWETEQPLTPLMTMMAPSLGGLDLSDIPNLVELPFSIQNFKKLEYLLIRDCIKLQTLPVGVNFKILEALDLSGCSQLTSFPNISTNIKYLLLNRTGIEEVPWWIQNFSKLIDLYMKKCNSLKRVSLNIYKLKRLETVDFSDCCALTAASWDDSPSELATETDNIHSKLPDESSSSLPEDYVPNDGVSFKFFNLDPEAFLHQRSIIFKQLVFLGEEVPSYFTHRTCGTSSSLIIPLLHNSLSQPFFRFRACTVVAFESEPLYAVYIHVNCRFKDKFGNSFDSFGEQQLFEARKKEVHLFIFDCHIPLSKDNAHLAQPRYDHVDIQRHISNRMDSTFRSKILDYRQEYHLSTISPSKFKLKGWGIRLLESSSSAENELGNPNTLPHVCEVDQDNETEHGEES